MSSEAIVGSIIIGGVAYELVRGKVGPAVMPPGPPNSIVPNSGSPISSVISGQGGVNPKPPVPVGGGRATGATIGTGTDPAKPGHRSASQLKLLMGNVATLPTGSYDDHGTRPSPAANGITADLQKKLDTVEAYAQQQYNNMDAVAKAKAAQEISDALNIQPPIPSNAAWATIASAAGGAAGAAAGAALCGPICGKVGAMCGAYLGTKLEDLIEKNYDDVKNWLDNKVWGSIKDAAKKVGNAVEDAAKKAADYLEDGLDEINPF
jgi:gas vesicle protein